MQGPNLASAALAVTLVAVGGWLAWWLFASPIAQTVRRAASPKARPLGAAPLWLAGACAIYLLGSLAASSEASVPATATDSIGLAWLAHGLEYTALTIVMAVGLASARSMAEGARAAGITDLRETLRGDRRRGWIALTAVGGLAAALMDVGWHLTGQDASAAHWLMGLTLSGAGLISTLKVAQQPGSDRRHSLFLLTLAAIVFNSLYNLLLLFWETPSPNAATANPTFLWIYPTVGGGMAFASLLLVKRQLTWRWSATTATIMYFGVRLIATILLALVQPTSPLPDLPLVFIGGALAIDWLPWEELSDRWVKLAAVVAAFVAGYLVVALPTLDARVDLPHFGAGEVIWTTIGTIVVCGIVAFVIRSEKS